MLRLLSCLLAAGALSAQPSKLMNPAALNEKAPEQYRAKFTTSRGEFVIAVNRSWAPLAADRFYNLVKNGFYDGCVFFRVLPGFVAQWGLHPRPAVQAKWEKATLKDEPRKHKNRLGYVAFAATGEINSRSTQVFINLKDSPDLDLQGFVPFGDVVKGIGLTAILNNRHGQKPDQRRILKQGNAYLKTSFPDLDYIKTAVIE